MMPKFGLILVLLLAKNLAQEDPEPIFKAVGETLEIGFCFGVDYIAVYKINEGEKQLLWNSSDSVSTPDAYKNRINASSLHGLLGLQIMDLKLSDSGTYLRECWAGGKLINQHTNYLYMCDEEIPSQELFLKNGGALLDCDITYSEHDGTSIKWFREVYPGYKTLLFLDTGRSQEPLQEELNNVLQVQDKGFSLYISEAGLEHNQNFVCLVINRGQCKSFKNIQLPESNKPETQSVYFGVGEKAALSCMLDHLNQQPNYWKTPLGDVGVTSSHSQMYISNSEGTRDHLLVIPSITLNHSGEYMCLSSVLVIAEYYVTVCSELVSDNVQLYNGGKVTLPCTLTKDESVNILWYRKKDLKEPQLIYDSGDPSIDMPADLMGRTHVLDSNSSLIITELNEKDSGSYWCVVLLDSVGQDINHSLDDDDDDDDDDVEEEEEGEEEEEEEEEEEDDKMDYGPEWMEEEETCIFKTLTHLKIRSKNLKTLNIDPSQNSKAESESEFSPVLYGIIGGVLGIVILGLIVGVVFMMRAKRRALDSSRAEHTARQKGSAVSAPLMSL